MEHLFNSQHLTDEQGNKLFLNEESSLAFQVIDPINHLLCVRKGLKIPDNGHLTIPDTAMIKQTPYKITRIASGAFKYEKQLRQITLGQELREIYANAFEGCINLKGTLHFPNNLIHIGEDAFAGTSISNFDGCEKLTELADGVFADCWQLTTIAIPDNIQKIGFGAFAGCTNLTTIQFGANINHIYEAAFYGCKLLKKLYYTGTLADWCRITFDTPDANPLQYVQEFYIGNAKSQQLVIPDGTTQIREYSFYKCQQVTDEIYLGNDLTDIGELAFYGCKNIKAIHIGTHARRINHRAFEGCNRITCITCRSQEPPVVAAPFRTILPEKCTLYVPEESIDKYRNVTAWDKFHNIQPLRDNDNL